MIMVSENSDPDQPDYQGPDRAHHRFRYGAWRGGPDPLKPPFDVREAIDRIGQDYCRLAPFATRYET